MYTLTGEETTILFLRGSLNNQYVITRTEEHKNIIKKSGNMLCALEREMEV